MDIMQKLHPKDLIQLSAKGRYGNRLMWVEREKFERIPPGNVRRFEIEVVQTAAYGTEDWKVANEATLS